MKDKYRNKFGVLFALLVMAAFALTGCSGSTGPAGPAGSPGASGAASTVVSVVNPAALTPEQADTFTMTGTVTSVTIASPPVVKFWLKDASGSGIINMGTKNAAGTALNNLRFALAKLVPGTNGSPDQWVSYMVTNTARPTTENNGTLVDNGDGSYTYTFTTDVTDPTKTGGVTYQPNLTHRLAIQCSGTLPGSTSTIYNPANIIYDFIPATGNPVGAADTKREIVSISACNECHGKLALHGGGRIDTKFCVVCHTDQRRIGRTEATTDAAGNFPALTYDATGRVNSDPGTYLVDDRTVGNFVNMIHKIHMGHHLTKQNYNFARVLFNEITFPQDQRNCRKCHKGDTAEQLAVTPQGNNWKTKPSRLACGACHDQVNFATGANHIGGARADDAFCVLCHDAADIELKHLPVDRSSTVPKASLQTNLPAGASKIAYDIDSVTVGGTPKRATVKFRILKDGAPATFNTYAAGTELLPNFTGGPTIYLAYAVPQDGITAPVDFNVSVNSTLKNIWDGTKGTLSARDANGYYTAVLGGGSANFGDADIPASAVMVTAGIGFAAFTQTNVPNYPSGLVLPATVVTKTAANYTARRAIVSNDNCNKCHATLGTSPTFHSGVRNNATVCSFCHTPNRTSSGWSARASSFIHGIHGASKHTVPYNWHSISLTQGFWEVTYPGILKNCETCHLPGTYDFSGAAYTDTLMNNQLYSTVATNGSRVFNTTTKIPGPGTYGDGTPAFGNGIVTYAYGDISYNAITAAAPRGLFGSATTALSPYVVSGTDYGPGFANNLNAADAAAGKTVKFEAAGTTLVTSPIATVCFSCHDSSLARAHMESNGGSVYAPRATALAKAEQCLLCHGPGRVADIKVMHSK